MATIELDGSIGNFTLDLETKKGMPLIIHAYYPQDASLRYMWSSQNLENTIKFLNETPVETNFMFVSYSCKSRLTLSAVSNVSSNMSYDMSSNCVFPPSNLLPETPIALANDTAMAKGMG